MHIDKNGKLRGLAGKTIFTEKDLSVNILITTVTPLYRQCFKRGVWNEDLSIESVVGRLENCFSRDFRGYFLFDIGEICIGASWYEYVNIDWIKDNKGSDLANFITQKMLSNNLRQIVWQTETLVHPDFAKQGLAGQLKSIIDMDLQKLSLPVGGILTATRMRDDNIAILKVNSKLQYNKTGIRMPCNLDPKIEHEYWFKIY
jgi:hypothetical protein